MARALYEDASFRQRMQELFESEPTGRLVIPTLESALNRIKVLEERIQVLEKSIRSLEKSTETAG